MHKLFPLLVLVLGTLCCRFNLEAQPIQALPETYLADLKSELTKEWPNNRAIQIVCHGHSVPAGYFKTPHVDSLNAYPHQLFKGLKAQYPNAVINVIVTAIGGEDSVQGAARFDSEVLTHRPDVLLIDYGLNDRRPGLKAAHEAWTSMITKAKAKGIKVILLTPTADQRARLFDPADPLNQHAEQIRSLAKENGVALVDSYARIQDHVKQGGHLEDLMSQVNHPNQKGHEMVARMILKWFKVKG